MWVRAIEYEDVPRDLAESVGLSPAEVNKYFGDSNELAVVRCVDRYGQKVTAVTDLGRFKQLLANGEAGDRDGMSVTTRTWPILLRGWLQPS